MTEKERKIDLVQERDQLERQHPALRKGFFDFVESFRKYKEMRRQVVGEGRGGAARAKR